MEQVFENPLYDDIEIELVENKTFKKSLNDNFKKFIRTFELLFSPCTKGILKIFNSTEKIKPFESKDIQYETNKECSICCNDFEIKEKIIKLTCKHIYHTGCIRGWLEIKYQCPLCEKCINPSVKGRILSYSIPENS